MITETLAQRRDRIWLRDGDQCWYCGGRPETSHQRHVDHLKPVSLGGSNRDRNVVAACGRCNSAKRNRTLEEYRQYLHERRLRTVREAVALVRQLAEPDDLGPASLADQLIQMGIQIELKTIVFWGEANGCTPASRRAS